jgi:hypothetical protein
MANVTLRKKISKQQVQFVLGLLPLLLIKNWKRSRREFLGLKVLTRDETEKHITNLH